MARRILCYRYLLMATFILLGIFGAVVCGTGSYFVHQLHGPLTNAKSYGPPILLLLAGIANILLGPYFWFFFDAKYNPAQLFMFRILVIIVGIIEGIAGVWAIVDHNLVDASISKILENNLASVGTINDGPAWNLTEIKVNCCGFEKYDYEDDEGRKISWSCCNTKRFIENQLDDDVDLCVVFYFNECRDLALHRYRSVLFFTFIVALCATIIQILEFIFLYVYTKKLMKKRRRQSTVAVATSPNQRSQMTCPVMQLGAHHVCEGCANEQYRER